MPAVRVVPPYYDHPAYLDAMAAVVRDDLARLPWEPEHFVVSFHGMPQKYAQRGDPYADPRACGRRAALVERLGLAAGRSGRRRTSRGSAATSGSSRTPTTC